MFVGNETPERNCKEIVEQDQNFLVDIEFTFKYASLESPIWVGSRSNQAELEGRLSR